MPQIDIDDEVYTHLEAFGKPFVDTPNSVLRRLLGLDSAPSREDGRMTAVTKQRSRSSAMSSRASDGHRRPERRRVARGLLLPESQYELPILEALVARGGTALASQVLDDVGQMLADRLTDLDHEVLSSGSIRWRNRAQWARNTLVNQGLLDPQAPWGTWIITAAGRRELARRTGNQAEIRARSG